MRPLPRLFAVTPPAPSTIPDFSDRMHRLVGLGEALTFVARLRPEGGDALSTLTAMLVAASRPTFATVTVAGRPDIAAVHRAAGVHLRLGDLPPREARAMHPRCSWIGRAVHSLKEAEDAIQDEADYLVYGNVFETGSHPGRPAAGVAGLRAVAALGVPVIAIGGVTVERAGILRDAGAWGAASISALWDAVRPEETGFALLDAWLS